MLSGAVAQERPDVDLLHPMQAYLPVNAPRPGQARRRERRPAIIKAVKAARRAARA